jgi:hypothetical protein
MNKKEEEGDDNDDDDDDRLLSDRVCPRPWLKITAKREEQDGRRRR